MNPPGPLELPCRVVVPYPRAAGASTLWRWSPLLEYRTPSTLRPCACPAREWMLIGLPRGAVLLLPVVPPVAPGRAGPGRRGWASGRRGVGSSGSSSARRRRRRPIKIGGGRPGRRGRRGAATPLPSSPSRAARERWLGMRDGTSDRPAQTPNGA